MLAGRERPRYSMGVSAPQQTKAFHLSYDGEEDRILIAVDVDPDRRYAMALTRRLAKLVLGALADLSGKRSASSARADPQHRDTVLNFEHASAVEAALASGDTKTHQPAKPFVQPARIVHEVKLTPRDDGDIVMVFYDRNQVLTLDLGAAARAQLHGGRARAGGERGLGFAAHRRLARPRQIQRRPPARRASCTKRAERPP